MQCNTKSTIKCNAMQSNPIQCNAIQCNEHNKMQSKIYNKMHHNAMTCNEIQCKEMQATMQINIGKNAICL